MGRGKTGTSLEWLALNKGTHSASCCKVQSYRKEKSPPPQSDGHWTPGLLLTITLDSQPRGFDRLYIVALSVQLQPNRCKLKGHLSTLLFEEATILQLYLQFNSLPRVSAYSDIMQSAKLLCWLNSIYTCPIVLSAHQTHIVGWQYYQSRSYHFVHELTIP